MREISQRTRRFAGAFALTPSLLLAACGEVEPPAPAFDAKLVLGTREVRRALLGFDATRSKLYLAETLTVFGGWEPGRSNTLSDIYTLDTASGEETLLMEKVMWFTHLGSETGERATLFLRQESLEYGMPATLTLLFEDGSRADYDHIVPSSVGWSDERLVFIRDGFPRELWAGPLREPRVVSGELYAHDWQFIGHDRLAFAGGLLAHELVSGQSVALDNPGIFTVDLPSGATSVEFPAEIAGAEWAGAEPAPDLASDGLAPQADVQGWVIAPLGGGCWSATESEAWGAADLRCYLLYVRRMTDGTLRAFVGLPDEHREIALPGEIDTTFSSADIFYGHYLAFRGNRPLAVWRATEGDAGQSTLAMWDAARARFSTCALPNATSYYGWRSDGRGLAFGGGETLGVFEAGMDDCFEFAAPQNRDPLFSPEASRLVWTADNELWSARGDGRGAERRLKGAELSRLGFIDEDRLLALRGSSDGQGLISLDLSEPVPREHAIVEQIFATGPRLGPHFLASGSRYNAQDRTGTFALIDLDANAPVDVADSVADYAVGFPAAAGEDSFPFAYLRIGRFASERDGIWVGRVPNALVE